VIVFPWEVGVMYIGIDPSTKATGVAVRGASKETGKIEQFSYSVKDILDSNKVVDFLEYVSQIIEFDRVVLAIEYPCWNAGAAQTIRASANTYIRLVRRMWSNAIVEKIDPNTWQGFFSFRGRGSASTKDFSMKLTKLVYCWPTVSTHDESDAALILEYVRHRPLPEKKKKKDIVNKK
jgi:Holliday junction resolvasome RuvABC endonuclease subunit